VLRPVVRISYLRQDSRLIILHLSYFGKASTKVYFHTPSSYSDRLGTINLRILRTSYRQRHECLSTSATSEGASLPIAIRGEGRLSGSARRTNIRRRKLHSRLSGSRLRDRAVVDAVTRCCGVTLEQFHTCVAARIERYRSSLETAATGGSHR
jgi:hypothetical protein